MKIYLASSWRNMGFVRYIAHELRKYSHEVFDFTNPGDQALLPTGFHWSGIDINWENWTPDEYRHHLQNNKLARDGLFQDFSAMRWADACVALMPFGRSASLELGWFIGQEKPSHILLENGEPELMFGLASYMHTTTEELIEKLNEKETFLGREIDQDGELK